MRHLFQIFDELITLNQENAFLNAEEQPDMPCLSPSVMVDSASVAEIEREKRRNSIQKVDQILRSSFLKRCFPLSLAKSFIVDL